MFSQAINAVLLAVVTMHLMYGLSVQTIYSRPGKLIQHSYQFRPSHLKSKLSSLDTVTLACLLTSSYPLDGRSFGAGHRFFPCIARTSSQIH